MTGARRSELVAHTVLFVGATLVVVAAGLLEPGADAVRLRSFEVPPLCLFYNLTGAECMGCGMTRAFAFLAHGDFWGAWEMNKLALPMFALVASQIPLRAWRILALLRSPVPDASPRG